MIGPVILVPILASWSLLLSTSAALIIHPNLGTGVVSRHGTTPTDFITALYVGGGSLPFIGATDFVPGTPAFRLFYLLVSIAGLTLVSRVVTYIIEVYSALKERTTLELMVQLLSSQTGDAAASPTISIPSCLLPFS